VSTEGPSSPNPWGSLEPDSDGPGAPVPLYPEVGSWRTLGRGLRKRCPRCASGGIFSSWFTLRAACPRCELRFEKEEGGYLGAMVLNFIVAVGLWVALLAVWLVFTVPDVPVLPLSIASCVLLIVVPLLFYPNSKAVWAAVEFLVMKTDPDYRPPVRRDPRARGLE
jgi:uncharacterized protein (DUF983 family)